MDVDSVAPPTQLFQVRFTEDEINAFVRIRYQAPLNPQNCTVATARLLKLIGPISANELSALNVPMSEEYWRRHLNNLANRAQIGVEYVTRRADFSELTMTTILSTLMPDHGTMLFLTPRNGQNGHAVVLGNHRHAFFIADGQACRIFPNQLDALDRIAGILGGAGLVHTFVSTTPRTVDQIDRDGASIVRQAGIDHAGGQRRRRSTRRSSLPRRKAGRSSSSSKSSYSRRRRA